MYNDILHLRIPTADTIVGFVDDFARIVALKHIELVANCHDQKVVAICGP